MGEKFVPIADVPPTYEPTKIVKIHNPFSTIFKHDHDGKEVRVPKGLSDITEPMAWFMAHHMAEQELVEPLAERERELRSVSIGDENWGKITQAIRGLKPEDVAKRAAEFVLDPNSNDKAVAKAAKERIKELQAA